MGRSGSEGGERREVQGLVRRGEGAMPEGAREFQGMVGGTKFRGRGPAEDLFFC